MSSTIPAGFKIQGCLVSSVVLVGEFSKLGSLVRFPKKHGTLMKRTLKGTRELPMYWQL